MSSAQEMQNSQFEETYKYYAPLELASLDLKRIPRHVAFILDGNRRWAKRKCCKAVSQGHQYGADILIEIIKAAKEIGIKTMTLYIFSTENWERSQEEVAALMWLFESYILNQIPTMLENSMRFDTIGDLSKMPIGVNNAISKAKHETANCGSIEVVFAMNYGARDEIRRAVQKLLYDFKANQVSLGEISEELIARYLDTKNYPDPDLLIRTGGELRISNFLLWQASYAEFYITDVLWPDFTPHHLLEAIRDFQTRDRRWGQ